MPFDSDVALLGTGVAPLIAAAHLIAQEKSVLILNPDFDFFLENSELSLDPLLSRNLKPAQLARSWPERALGELRPEFPGAVEFWSPTEKTAGGFRDPEAPHVRQRSRLWITETGAPRSDFSWENLEELYVEASDAGFKPQILEGLQAAAKFPGFSKSQRDFRGLLLPKLCDVDVSRYRNGLLEFLEERLGPDRLVRAAAQIELMPDGVRFHAQGSPRTARLNQGMLVFWTPRLTQWVMAQAKKSEVAPILPEGIRLWEEWSVISRESLDPSVVGNFGNMTVWAEAEGAPRIGVDPINRLAILRSGPRVGVAEANLPPGGQTWASAESFDALHDLCLDFLGWEDFSVRSMRPRAIFEWGLEKNWSLSESGPSVEVVTHCDGPVVEIARVARNACARFLQ